MIAWLILCNVGEKILYGFVAILLSAELMRSAQAVLEAEPALAG